MEGKTIQTSALTQLVKLTKSEFNTASQARKVTLGASWDYDSTNDYYTQSVLVVGMKETDTPQLSVEISSISDADSINEEFAKVIDAETYDGGIKFYASSATTRNLTVVIKPELSKVTVNNVSSAEAGLDKLQNNINVTNGVHAFSKSSDAGTQVTFNVIGTVKGEAMILTCEENIERASMFIINAHGNRLYRFFNVFKSSDSTATVEVTEKQIVVTCRPWSQITLYTAENTFE